MAYRDSTALRHDVRLSSPETAPKSVGGYQVEGEITFSIHRGSV